MSLWPLSTRTTCYHDPQAPQLKLTCCITGYACKSNGPNLPNGCQGHMEQKEDCGSIPIQQTHSKVGAVVSYKWAAKSVTCTKFAGASQTELWTGRVWEAQIRQWAWSLYTWNPRQQGESIWEVRDPPRSNLWITFSASAQVEAGQPDSARGLECWMGPQIPQPPPQ